MPAQRQIANASAKTKPECQRKDKTRMPAQKQNPNASAKEGTSNQRRRQKQPNEQQTSK
jgi:hypothetical protein